MDRKVVQSQNIRSIGYDSNSNILEVEFVSGGIYQYFDIPAHLHFSLMNAISKGKFFDANVKDHYRYRKIN